MRQSRGGRCRSSSSIASTSSDRACRLRAQLQALQLQVEGLQARLQDKDALIAELNRCSTLQ